MDANKRTEYIKVKLTEKGINTETQDNVSKYVNINEILFGDVLDIDKVTDRILNNLSHSISTYDMKSNRAKGLMKLVSSRGFWDAYEHRIEINPIHKFLSRFSKSAKQRYDSTIMHEIDHCATTEYMDVSTYFGVSEEEMQDIVKKEGLEETFEKVQNKHGGKLAAVGISRIFFDGKKKVKGLTSKNLRMLNEGITAYKQETYDDFLGNKHKTNYKIPKMVAGFIAEVIGKEKLIQMQFNNDYNGIRTAFQEVTGQNLDDIVSRLKPTSSVQAKLFDKLYTIKWENIIKKTKQGVKKTKEIHDPMGLSSLVINDKEYIQEMEKTSQSNKILLDKQNKKFKQTKLVELQNMARNRYKANKLAYMLKQ